MDPDEVAGWFAGRLKELRTKAGLSQPGLAEKAGLTKDGIAHLEQGRRLPGWVVVLMLCKALGVTPDAFLKKPKPQAKQPPRQKGKQEP